MRVKFTPSFVESYPALDDLEDFVPYAVELASTLKNTILVDQIPYHYQRREELMQLLDEHITENIVKVEDMRNRICSTHSSSSRIRSGVNIIGRSLGSHKDRCCPRYCAPSLTEIWNAASSNSARTRRA